MLGGFRLRTFCIGQHLVFAVVNANEWNSKDGFQVEKGHPRFDFLDE